MPADQLADLSKYGLLGLLLCIALGVIAYLFRLITKDRDQVMSDLKTVITSNTVQMKEQQVGNDARVRAFEAQTRALELMTASTNHLTEEIARLRESVSEVGQSHRAMEVALVKKGVDL